MHRWLTCLAVTAAVTFASATTADACLRCRRARCVACCAPAPCTSAYQAGYSAGYYNAAYAAYYAQYYRQPGYGYSPYGAGYGGYGTSPYGYGYPSYGYPSYGSPSYGTGYGAGYGYGAAPRSTSPYSTARYGNAAVAAPRTATRTTPASAASVFSALAPLLNLR